MSYIIKNTSALINTLMTDAARKKISQGKFDIAYFQVGDSEVCYNCVSNMDMVDYNVLMPQYNAQNLSPVPQKNRMHVKYPLFIDSTSGSTFGIPFDNSYIDNVYNSAAPRGFFTGSTGSSISFSAFTSSAYTINPNFVVDNSTISSGNVLTLSATSINPSVSGTVTPGMFLTLFGTDSLQPLSAATPMFTYLVVSVSGDSSTASTINIEVDRQLPNFSSLGLSGNSSTMIYPSGMTVMYDTFTPQPFWATDVFNFETNCDVSQRNVYIWNMNIPWTESPAGLFSTTYQDFNQFKSTGYTNTKEYLGYNSETGQLDTDSVYYYNSFLEKITVTPSEQKAIAIIHYTNQSIDNFYGEKFAMEDYDPTNPGNTGQARNFKLSIPWLMWHKNPNGTIGEVFYTDPSGFTNQNLFQVHYIKSKKDLNFNAPGLRYYHLWDTHANTNGTPNRVGKVFPDLKMIVFDDDEIIAALNYKSNRSWTLPAPKLGLVTPNTFSGVLGGTDGLLTGDTETLYLTYLFENTGFTNSLHCNYYTKIVGPNTGCTNLNSQNVTIQFGNEFNCLTQPSTSIDIQGFYANEFKLLVQKVSGTSRPDSSQWREIDFTDQLTPSMIDGYIHKSGMTQNTFVITKDLYDSASIYDLNDYIPLTQLNDSGTTLNFGDEYYFYGSIETDIEATIYEMRYKINLSQTEYQTPSNPTWSVGTPKYLTEIGLYDDQKNLMIISKMQSPVLRQGTQQFLVKLDF